jgi:hypothetical protein
MVLTAHLTITVKQYRRTTTMINIPMHPTNAALKDAGYTIEEEEQIYDSQLQDILDNVSWYLDNYETLVTYKVGRIITTRPQPHPTNSL